MAIEAGLVLFFVFVVLLVLGMPIAISIAFSSMMTLLLVIPFDVSAFSSAQKMVGSINSFSLIAIPFFVLSGIIMNNGGIAKKLVDFAMLFVGRVPGALAHTNVLGNALFGSISSSAIAASTAIGGVLIPQQVEEDMTGSLRQRSISRQLRQVWSFLQVLLLSCIHLLLVVLRSLLCLWEVIS